MKTKQKVPETHRSSRGLFVFINGMAGCHFDNLSWQQIGQCDGVYFSIPVRTINNTKYNNNITQIGKKDTFH